MDFHEIANIFPMMSGVELNDLAADIKANGLLEPLVTLDGKILDGRNRYLACKIAEVQPKYEMWTRTGDPLDYVISKNLHRRHLDESQRAMVGARLANMGQGARTDLASIEAMSQPQAATLLNVGRPSIQRAKTVLENGVHSLITAVDSGSIAVSVAAQIANLPTLQQEAIMSRVYSGYKATDAIREMKRDEKRAELEDIAAQEVKATKGVFDVIVIDPPWPMQKIERDVTPSQVEFDYPTMSLKDIAALKIPCADDCHVWLWTTHKFLPDAFSLLKIWGLTYVCTFVWHKPGGFQPFNLPQYNCEFVLYSHKGNPQFMDTKAFPTCFDAPRTGHSEKPEEFYAIVRRVTAGRRLDMFNRRQIDGFERWGNEAE